VVEEREIEGAMGLLAPSERIVLAI
jgi:hypothetical protein